MSTYPPDPRRSGPSSEDPDALTCACVDPEAHLVAALVAGGMGLMEACGYVWGNRTPDAATSVRIGYAKAVTWLRLPLTIEGAA